MPSGSSSKPAPPRSNAAPRLSLGSAAASLVLFALLAALHTWPLASAPGTLSRNDNGDTLLNEWTLAWVQHQVLEDPAHLFDANIFHPEKNALAFSEHMFTQAMLGLPLFVAGASPVLVFNVLLLAGFALSGWTTCLVVKHVTGDWPAGVLAGTLLSFNAYALTHLPHLQSVHLEFVAPAVLALFVLLTKPGAGPALWLAAMVVLQSLTSNYFMVALAFAILAAALVRLRAWREHGVRLLLWALVSAGLTGAALLPFILPYVDMQAAHGLKRALDPQFSATWRDYLTTGSRMHFDWWSRQFWGVRAALFPGVTALLLAAAAIVSGVAWRDRFARMWLAIGVLLALMSLGVHTPWYRWAYEYLGALQGIRSPARLGQFAVCAVAVLAGFGLASARARWRGRAWVPLATGIVLVAANVEALRAPLGYVPAPPIPGAYDRLRGERRAVVAELPLPPPSGFHRNTEYMLGSTRHWRPIMNGYSGFVPASYVQAWRSLSTFPSNAALWALRDAGVTHVVLHHQSIFPSVEVWPRSRPLPDALQLLVESDALSIYHLRWERIPDQP